MTVESAPIRNVPILFGIRFHLRDLPACRWWLTAWAINRCTACKRVGSKHVSILKLKDRYRQPSTARSLDWERLG